MTDEARQPSGGRIEITTLAAPSDVEVARLAAIFDRYRAHYGEPSDTSGTATWLHQHLSAGRIVAFVAAVGDESVGFAIATAVPASLRLGSFWQIRDLFVMPDHRRRGVAGALLECIRVAAIAAGALRVSLQTETDNTMALRLYEQHGYTVVEGYRSLMLPLTPDVEPS